MGDGGHLEHAVLPQDQHLQGEEASAAACPPARSLSCLTPMSGAGSHFSLASYLLPLSGSWPPTPPWELLPLLDTSLSSAPRKRSRKESGLWSWGYKCLVAHRRSEIMWRHNLEGDRPAAAHRGGRGAPVPSGLAQVAPHYARDFIPASSARFTWDTASSERDVVFSMALSFHSLNPTEA